MILTPEMRERRARELWEELHEDQWEEITPTSVRVTAWTTLALFVGAGVMIALVVWFR